MEAAEAGAARLKQLRRRVHADKLGVEKQQAEAKAQLLKPDLAAVGADLAYLPPGCPSKKGRR